jgi:hypothetical protein
MKNALISPLEEISYISGWQSNPIDMGDAIWTKLGWRVADTANPPFEVASPYFWVECADNVVRDLYYYDPNTKQINPVPPNVPMP